MVWIIRLPKVSDPTLLSRLCALWTFSLPKTVSIMESNQLLPAESSPSPSHTDLPTASPKDLLIASYDILILIFKLFIPTVATADAPENQLARVGRKQLLNLALTCKSFVDPALECLWSHLESLDPLFGLHPGLENVDGSYVRSPSSIT